MCQKEPRGWPSLSHDGIDKTDTWSAVEPLLSQQLPIRMANGILVESWLMLAMLRHGFLRRGDMMVCF